MLLLLWLFFYLFSIVLFCRLENFRKFGLISSKKFNQEPMVERLRLFKVTLARLNRQGKNGKKHPIQDWFKRYEAMADELMIDYSSSHKEQVDLLNQKIR